MEKLVNDNCFSVGGKFVGVLARERENCEVSF